MARRTLATSLATSLALVAGCAFITFAPPAHADDVAMAEKLFLEGKRLMDEGTDYPKACAKFQAAHDLDATATGTLLNLALCHEKTHHTATAWAEFRQVIAESIGRRPDRVAMARLHEAKLAPLLSVIVFDVGIAPPAGLHIAMDKSRVIPEASWGVELPIDPGKHVLDISAPGKTSRLIEVVVGDEADKQKVVIPVLADAPADRFTPLPRDRPATNDPGAGRRQVGWVLGGVGIAATAVGAVFGVLAASKNSDADEAVASCPNGTCPNEAARSRALDANDDAKTNATISNVTIGVGIGLIAAGVILVLTGRPTNAARASSKPYVAPSHGTSMNVLPRQSGGAFLFAREW